MTQVEVRAVAGATTKTCPMCRRTFPLTVAFWYVHKSGPKEGLVTGYCRQGCQQRACRERTRAWEQSLSGERLARRRIQKRDYWRRVRLTDPSRYRRSVYEDLLAGQTADQVAAEVASATCPACGSVRLEAARTRTGSVVICWRCGWRDTADQQAAS